MNVIVTMEGWWKHPFKSSNFPWLKDTFSRRYYIYALLIYLHFNLFLDTEFVSRTFDTGRIEPTRPEQAGKLQTLHLECPPYHLEHRPL